MGVLKEVSDTDSQHSGQNGNVPAQKKRASFPSRERHYAMRRKPRSHSPPFHRCNRVPPQLPPVLLPCDCECCGDSSEERQGILCTVISSQTVEARLCHLHCVKYTNRLVFITHRFSMAKVGTSRSTK